MANAEIRMEIISNGLKHWQVAEAAGISPYTLSVWLRHDLSGERLERVQSAVAKLIGGDRNA
jgi:hypothetical protein